MIKMDVLAKKSPALLLGNQAITRGALEAGIDVVTTYPGTPASEIADSFSAVAKYLKSQKKDPGFYFQYSVNEKVAVEFAAAASICGLRSLTCMKHVGLNVASDAFLTYMYVGCKAGHIIVTADDPSCHSSQNEQDNRIYSKLAHAPMFEPSDPQEAKDMALEGFTLSEKLKIPLLLRTTTRVSHVRGPVTLNPLKKKKTTKGIFRKNPLLVTVPAVARQLHSVLLEKMDEAAAISEKIPFNYIINHGGTKGIITSGPSYGYVRDVINELHLECKILKLGMTHPLPKKLCKDFLKSCDEVIIVEELEPFIEEQIRAIAYDEDVKIYGKGAGHFSRLYEYTPDIVAHSISEIFHLKHKTSSDSPKVKLPARPPVLCPGCPHRATYYAVKQVVPKDTIFPTDIGCYTLGNAPPLKIADYLLCMGSNVGTACGFSYATEQKVVSFMGDSTFFHSSLPGIVNAVHHNNDCVITVLDNRTTAMTGHQPHPGTSKSGMGENIRMLKIEDVAKGLGIQHIEVVNPTNIEETKKAFIRSLRYKGPSVVVSRAPCILLIVSNKRKHGKNIIPYTINQHKCTQCKICINKFGCPAFFLEGNQVKIDKTLCTSCGVCQQICPSNAIEKEGNHE